MIVSGGTVGEILRSAARLLKERKEVIATPDLDARLLLQDVSGFSHSEIVSHEKEDVPLATLERFNEHLKRRLQGEPVHRITEMIEFYGREFFVGKGALLPRPETELLIDTVLAHCADRKMPVQIADLGTGTGIIAITLALELERANILAVDVSEDALETARRNVAKFDLADRVSLMKGNFLDVAEGEFDVVVSNPPYIRTGDLADLQPEVRLHDPVLALDGGKDGLDCYREIIRSCHDCLNPDGRVILEIGFDQAEAVTEIACSHGFDLMAVQKDLAQLDRVIVLNSGH